MVQIYVEISKNVSFFISCIKFRKIFIESFNEISLIRRSENNSNNYQLGFWQMDFKENIFNVRGDLRRLPVTLTIPQQTRSPLNLQVLNALYFLSNWLLCTGILKTYLRAYQTSMIIVCKGVPAPSLFNAPTRWPSLHPLSKIFLFPPFYSVPPPFKIFYTLPPPSRNLVLP